MNTTKVLPNETLPLTCIRKGTCCHGNKVNLNPWELAQIAHTKGITPSAFREQFCDFGGILLRFDGARDHRQLAACSQYIPDFGCSVHAGRPLACRLFPLGRQKQGTETNYIYQGEEFPCMTGCSDVVNHPKMTVAQYIKGQDTIAHEQVQDAYLEVMQNLADIAFAFLLETELAASGDRKTLRLWKVMANESPDALVKRIGEEWMNLLMVSELDISVSPLEFVSQHNHVLESTIQNIFGTAATQKEWHEVSCLMMSMALLLAHAIGADANALCTHWVAIAKQHGALD